MKFIDIPAAERKALLDNMQTIIGLRGFDYSTLQKQTLSFLPPKDILVAWKEDYETMQQEMIYGASVPFDKIISDLKELNDKINQMQ